VNTHDGIARRLQEVVTEECARQGLLAYISRHRGSVMVIEPDAPANLWPLWTAIDPAGDALRGLGGWA